MLQIRILKSTSKEVPIAAFLATSYCFSSLFLFCIACKTIFNVQFANIFKESHYKNFTILDGAEENLTPTYLT